VIQGVMEQSSPLDHVSMLVSYVPFSSSATLLQEFEINRASDSASDSDKCILCEGETYVLRESANSFVHKFFRVHTGGSGRAKSTSSVAQRPRFNLYKDIA
jgi:hypothetical protein